MDDVTSIGDPRLRSLTLRANAAEEVVVAAKIFCRITHLEAVAANLEVQRLRYKEEAENITARGLYFYNKMKGQQAQMDSQKGPKEELAADVMRNREKAMRLSAQAAAHEKKMGQAEEKARSALSEAARLRKERDRHLLDAKKLEAEAVRVETLI